jgi:hypothetical protein
VDAALGPGRGQCRWEVTVAAWRCEGATTMVLGGRVQWNWVGRGCAGVLCKNAEKRKGVTCGFSHNLTT